VQSCTTVYRSGTGLYEKYKGIGVLEWFTCRTGGQERYRTTSVLV